MKRTHHLLTLILLSTAIACPTPEGPMMEEEAPPSILDSCDESVDFEDSGWMGPGVGDDGQLLEPRDTYIMAVTGGVPRASEAEQVQFGMHNMRITEDLFTRDGFIAANLGGSNTCRTGRTISLWRDRDAMMAFVLGEAHLLAMREVSAVLQESKTGHVVYEPSTPGALPTWQDYHDHMDTLTSTLW